MKAKLLFYGLAAVGGMLLFAVMLLLWVVSRKKYAALRRNAHIDPVSGALSDVGFADVWAKRLDAHAESLAVISMEIPELAVIGSTYGTEAFRKKCADIVSVISGEIRQHDPVARTGENTFSFVIRSRKQDQLRMKLQTITNVLGYMSKEENSPVRIFPACGVYFPGKSDTAETAVRNAAFARPAHTGRLEIVFFDEAAQLRAERDRELVQGLEDLIRRREFVVYYQPKIRLADARIIGLEALVRWRHPQKGVLTPDMFLPILERYHAVPILDRFVWEEVCRLLARWKREERELCPISVNLSRDDLANEKVSEYLYGLCCKYEIDPGYIEVECKERDLLEDLEWAKTQIGLLHKCGFRVNIDNYGADSVSLALLGSVQPDSIKIDYSFFGGNNNNHQGRILLDTLLRQSAQLRIFTVAEGVDSLGQVKYLRQAACDCVQGFYFFKPMPVERLVDEIYTGKALKALNTEAASDDQNKTASEQNFDQEQKTSKNVILFTYWPAKNDVMFSDRFSPVLDSLYIERADVYFRSSSLIYQNDKQDFFDLLERSVNAEDWVENTLRVYGPDRRYEWMELRLKKESESEGGRVSGMLVNMAGWRNEINRWKQKAIRDTMTGVYNKEYFEQTVSKQLEDPNFRDASMIFVDMDYLKKVNDTFGHMFADDVIRYLSKQLLSIFRHTDVIARYGGDEFVVFAPTMDQAVLQDRLQRLYKVFSLPYRTENKEFSVSVSIGVAFYGKDGTDFDTLLEHADCALYEAKERGRNQYVLYEPYMLGEPLKAAETEQE